MLDDCDPVRILKSEISRVAFSSKYTRPLTYENVLLVQEAVEEFRQKQVANFSNVRNKHVIKI